MGVLLGAIASCVMWLIATGSQHQHLGKLHLQPPKELHAFFTGDSFFVACVAGRRSGATRLTWQAPSGRDITVGAGRVHVEPSPHNPLGLELVFEDVKHQDRGKYTCSAIIDGQVRKVHFELYVHSSITFTGTPEVQIGEEGEDFTVICNVNAHPKPIVSWYVNGSLVQETTRTSYTDDNGLFIRGLRPSDAGNYTCLAVLATIYATQVKNRTIYVSVHYRPKWHVPHMVTTHGVMGSATNLTCAAHSQPPPTFEWFRERALLGNSKVYTIINHKWKSILQVQVNDSSVFGKYECYVSNSMGTNQRTIRLVEGVVPDPPVFQLTSDEPGIIVVRFELGDNSPLPVLGYRVQWRLATDDTWRQTRYHQVRDGPDYVIHNLSFESVYSVRAAAFNAVGYGNYSEEVAKRTKGLVAETVVDGSGVSSSLSSAPPSPSRRCCRFHHRVALVVLWVIALVLR